VSLPVVVHRACIGYATCVTAAAFYLVLVCFVTLRSNNSIRGALTAAGVGLGLAPHPPYPGLPLGAGWHLEAPLDQPQRRPLSVSRIGLSRSDRDRPSSGVADRLFQTPHRSSGGGGSLLGLPPLGVGGLSASSSSLSSASARKVLSRHTGELQRQLTALQVSPLLCVELSSHSPEILLAGLGQLELAARTSAASTVELTGALLELPCTASSQHGTVQLVLNELYSQY